MHAYLRYITLLSILCLLGCSGDAPTAGGTTDTGNAAVACAITYSDSTPVANASVYLRKPAYLPEIDDAPASPDAVTDDDGLFVVEAAGTGAYVIEVNDNAGFAVRIDCDVIDESDTLELDTETLLPVGTVSGSVDLTDTAQGQVFAQVYGMERLAPVDSTTGQYSIADLPEGSYTVRVVARSTWYTTHEEPVALVSGGSESIAPVTLTSFFSEDYSQWGASTTVTLNTTATGADVADDVLDFPVLIRLDPSALTPQPAARGADIRFSKPDGAKLPYEIEAWDTQAAAVWVLVDTVYGNATTQITMHWGNAGVYNWSKSENVFAVAGGFLGVWHLNETGGDHGDATANNHDAVSTTVTVQGGAGLLGGAGYFNGTSDNVRIPHSDDFNLSGGVEKTLSVWFALDAQQVGRWAGPFRHSEGGYPGEGWGFECGVDNDWDMQIGARDGDSGATANDIRISNGVNMLDEIWHQAVAVMDGSQASLYIDGVLVGTDAYADMNDYNGNLYIGGKGTDYLFKGWLDECRVESIARREGWVRLCYDNQRSGSGFATLLP